MFGMLKAVNYRHHYRALCEIKDYSLPIPLKFQQAKVNDDGIVFSLNFCTRHLKPLLNFQSRAQLCLDHFWGSPDVLFRLKLSFG